MSLVAVQVPTLCARHFRRRQTPEQHWACRLQRLPTCTQPKWNALASVTPSTVASAPRVLPATPVSSRRREDAATDRERLRVSKRSASMAASNTAVARSGRDEFTRRHDKLTRLTRE